jgi:hypothetical protein|tara:strand:- start:2497 stop:2946 length:450 start_codon:yes stop_codon:yes gene_type:complete
MKNYYFVSLMGATTGTVTLAADRFTVNLLGKNYKSVKVVSAKVSSAGDIQYSINLRLHSYTGNGQSTDRQYPVAAMFRYDTTAGVAQLPPTNPPTVEATDFYQLQDFTPEYLISSSLNELVFSFTGSFDAVLIPGDLHFEFMLELDEEC